MKPWLITDRRLFVTGLIGLATPALAGEADDPEWWSCARDPPAVAVKSCTAVLNSGNLSKRDMAQTLFNRGAAYKDLGDTARAFDDFSEALRYDRSHPRAFAARGFILFGQGKIDAAAADFDAALKVDPAYARGYMGRSMVRGYRGQFDAAIADSDRALKLDPNDEPWVSLNNRGSYYAATGRFDRALSDVNAALAAKPGYALAFNNRGLIYEAIGEPERALPDFDNAVRLLPSSAQAYANRGSNLWKAGDDERALADLTKAVELDPTLAYARVKLAEVRQAREAAGARLARTTIKGRRVALIIGNSAYRSISPLPNAVADAREIAQALRGLGYEVLDRYDLTSPDLRSVIDQFQTECAETAEAAVVWYAGHGQSFDVGQGAGDYIAPSDNFILPVDFTSADNVVNKGVTLGSLVNAVVPAAGLRLVVIDACRPNNLKSSRSGFSSTEASPLPGKGLSPLIRDVLVVYSTQRGALASDGPVGGHSPFAQAFLESLDAGEARTRDIRLLFDGVAGRTLELTASQQRPQSPQRGSGLRTSAVLTLAATP